MPLSKCIVLASTQRIFPEVSFPFSVLVDGNHIFTKKQHHETMLAWGCTYQTWTRSLAEISSDDTLNDDTLAPEMAGGWGAIVARLN